MISAGDVIFFDFTGIYEKEGFAETGYHLDMRELKGTGMYVDDEAERIIRARLDSIEGLKGYRLRFLDNGNYHYMTRILASYIDEPFDLITFDNHTDDKPPAFGGLRSCGSWRLDIRAENPRLQSSLLIRKKEDFEMKYVPSDLPLYISIDKDILCESVLKTNWDQGDMMEDELFGIIETLMGSRRILAFDVCGEDLADAPCEANRRFNERIIEIRRRYESGRCDIQKDVRGYTGSRYG